MLAIEPFLTAYDPSDLPGASVDPLGFDRAYQFLADAILPGLTNVANVPRYWSVLCAALALSDEGAPGAETHKQKLARRREGVQRLERFWALACVRAAAKSGGELPASGIRGLRYVRREIERQGERATSSDGDFKLLARQVQYGLLGIYGAVAERLSLVQGDLELHPELGRQLADAFREETRIPRELEQSMLDGREVELSALEDWGARAHHRLAPNAKEGSVLKGAFQLHDVRRRMGNLLEAHPFSDFHDEQARLNAIRVAVADAPNDGDLRDALAAIGLFEVCFRAASLAFQGLLHRVQQGAALDLDVAARLPAVELARDAIAGQVELLDPVLNSSVHLRGGAGRWGDALGFLKDLAHTPHGGAFVLCILARHREVQYGKFDRGVRKTPWLEVLGATVRLTLSEAQRVTREPTSLDQVAPHEYRTWTAERLLGRAAT
jgi:hypothetical protein